MTEQVNHRQRLFDVVGHPENPPFKAGVEFNFAARIFDVFPDKPGKDRFTLVQVPDISTDKPLEPGLYLVRRVLAGPGGKPYGRYHLVVSVPNDAGDLVPLWSWVRNDDPQTPGRTHIEGQIPSDKGDLHFIHGALSAVTALFYPDENLPLNFHHLERRYNWPERLIERQASYMKQPE